MGDVLSDIYIVPHRIKQSNGHARNSIFRLGALPEGGQIVDLHILRVDLQNSDILIFYIHFCYQKSKYLGRVKHYCWHRVKNVEHIEHPTKTVAH